MKELCACKKHEFEYQLHEADESFECPNCGREYTLWLEMGENGFPDVDFALTKSA